MLSSPQQKSPTLKLLVIGFFCERADFKFSTTPAVKHNATMLPLLGEKVLPTAVRPGLVSYCPTMDLIALVTIDEQLHVFRINGQKVFSVTSRKIKRIVQLRWKPNGDSMTP